MARAQFVTGSTAMVGTDDFNAALRRMNRNLYNEFRRARSAIARTVVAQQKSKANAYSRQAAAAAAAIAVTAVGGGVGVSLKKSKVPFALGAEFGAKQYPQFPGWTGNQWSGNPEGVGYWFHPGIVESQAEVLDLYMAAVNSAASKAGIDVSGTPTRAGVLGNALTQSGV